MKRINLFTIDIPLNSFIYVGGPYPNMAARLWEPYSGADLSMIQIRAFRALQISTIQSNQGIIGVMKFEKNK